MLEPAGKHNLQSLAKTRGCMLTCTLCCSSKTVCKIFKKYCGISVFIYPLIKKTENRKPNTSEPKKREFLCYLCNFL